MEDTKQARGSFVRNSLTAMKLKMRMSSHVSIGFTMVILKHCEQKSGDRESVVFVELWRSIPHLTDSSASRLHKNSNITLK
jgi:hypothetical protein